MRCISCLLIAITLSLAFTANAAERAYPTKPIRLISAYAPGGGNDTVGRAIAQKLTDAFGQQVVGSSQHLAGALFGSTFGLNLVHVPYKGTGPMTNDLLGGQITMSFANSVAALPHVRTKRLVALAVTSLTRSSSLPDVPAVAETIPGFEATSWWGIVAPRATPAAIVDTLNREIVKGLNSPDMKTFMSGLGAEPHGTTPQEFAVFIRSELTKWSKVVKESGARAD